MAQSVYRRALFAAASTLSIFGGAQAALAQDASDTIIVTAQKREQDIQDVPIAVTAIGA